LASDLSNQGSRVHEDWLREYFNAPYQIRPILTERMPNFYMTDEELEMLLLYSSLVLVENEISNIPDVVNETQSIAKGESLFFDDYACQSCHQVGSIGGQVGPSLDKIGSRLTTAWIYHWLKDPHKYHPKVVKPNQGLSDDEAIAIAYYLSSLK
jgi:cytochrome c2